MPYLKRFRLILISLCAWLFLGLNAQDVHFSQFNGSLLNLSPGYTGLFNGDYRFNAIYRSQWTAVPVSYSSFSMNGEMRYKPDLDKLDALGIGLVFNNDKAGAANYGSSQIYVNTSYIHYLNADSSMVITGGLNLGYCNVGFDYTKMTFDNQYNADQFNAALPTGEKFYRTAGNYFDITIGSVFQYTKRNDYRITYALGLHHLTRPVISFQGNDLNRIDFKMTHCVSYTKPVKDNTDFIGEALFSMQGKYYEIIPHLALKYYVDKPSNQSLMGGICWRARDAFVLRGAYSIQSFQAGLSYDINYSKFSAATNYRGAFEIFMNYVIKRKSFVPSPKRTCPISF